MASGNHASTKFIVWILRILLFFFILNKCLSSSRNRDRNQDQEKKLPVTWPHTRKFRQGPNFMLVLNLQWSTTFVGATKGSSPSKLEKHVNSYGYQFNIHGFRIKNEGAPIEYCLEKNIFESKSQEDKDNLERAFDEIDETLLDQYWPSLTWSNNRLFWAYQW